MKKKNAISLIVLVITITVMAILAATIIITLSNTNIISEANDAVNKTEAHKVVSKKEAFVYNYISWGDSADTTGAVYLSHNMYKNSTSVASTLC